MGQQSTSVGQDVGVADGRGLARDEDRGDRLGSLAIVALAAAVGLWVVLSIGSIFLITLGTDEAWVLMGLRSLVLPQIVEGLSWKVNFTSGGLYTLGNLLIEVVAGPWVWLHRLYSWACLMGALGLLYALGRRRGGSRRAGLLMIAPVLGVPGAAEVGTTALGTSLAFLLLLLAAWVWSRAGEGTQAGYGRVIGAGLLFGLAAAARLEVMMFAPAVLAAAFIRLREPAGLRFRFPGRELAVVMLGLALIAVNIALIRTATPDEIEVPNPAESLSPTGLTEFGLDYPRLLNKVPIGQGFGPLPLLIVASLIPFWGGSSEQESADPGSGPARRFALLLMLSGWALWVSWHLRAPIPHLRYLWIALGCFAVLLGIGLVRLDCLAERLGRGPGRVAVLLVALSFVLSGVGMSARSLVLGDADLLSWEWSRETGFDYFRRFQAVQDQAAAAEYLATRVPAEDVVVGLGPQFILRYLASRPVFEIKDVLGDDFGGRRVHLVLTPATGTYLYLRPEAYDWIASEGRLEAQFGRYSIYEVPGGFPADATFLVPLRSNYEGHPLSSPWFGRRPAVGGGRRATSDASRGVSRP